jgi:hypothetical protein
LRKKEGPTASLEAMQAQLLAEIMSWSCWRYRERGVLSRLRRVINPGGCVRMRGNCPLYGCIDGSNRNVGVKYEN